jgi:hypothetical protein
MITAEIFKCVFIAIFLIFLQKSDLAVTHLNGFFLVYLCFLYCAMLLAFLKGYSMNEFEDTRFYNDTSPQRIFMLDAANRQLNTLHKDLQNLPPFDHSAVSNKLLQAMAHWMVKASSIILSITLLAVGLSYFVKSL